VGLLAPTKITENPQCLRCYVPTDSLLKWNRELRHKYLKLLKT
jgi:hypothetical protein